ncbi:hypothetical protein ACYZUD_28535 [Pseudomonas sp. XS1P51]
MTDKEKTEQLKFHLLRADSSDADSIMIERLENILQGTLEITDTDQRFLRPYAAGA